MPEIDGRVKTIDWERDGNPLNGKKES